MRAVDAPAPRAHDSRVADPERSLERRVEVARQSGVPVEPLRRWAEERRESNPGIAAVIEPHRELVPGVEVESDHGAWSVHYTPGHAPSHVVLFQPEQRLLLSGDHLLGRVSLYFDYGWTPDPVAEFLESLDTVDALDARLCLPGHGRPFGDVAAHIDANRTEISASSTRSRVRSPTRSSTAYEVVPLAFREVRAASMMGWALTIMLCFLAHLELTGRVERVRTPDEQASPPLPRSSPWLRSPPLPRSSPWVRSAWVRSAWVRSAWLRSGVSTSGLRSRSCRGCRAGRSAWRSCWRSGAASCCCSRGAVVARTPVRSSRTSAGSPTGSPPGSPTGHSTGRRTGRPTGHPTGCRTGRP